MLRERMPRLVRNTISGTDSGDGYVKRGSNYTMKAGKNISFRHADQKQAIRLKSLGEGNSEDELRAAISGERKHIPYVRKKYLKHPQRTTLISDIEAKLNSGKGKWYDRTHLGVKAETDGKDAYVY